MIILLSQKRITTKTCSCVKKCKTCDYFVRRQIRSKQSNEFMKKSSRVIDVYQESLLAKFKKLDKLK